VTTLRTLEGAGIETLTAAFNRAFSEYEVPMNMSADRLAEMHRRRGVRLDRSVGVFDGGDLVGFTFNGFGIWNGAPTGYDCGTGVAREYRGQGLSTAMLEQTKTLLREVGAATYLLEVLQSNAPAIGAYRKAGFETTRDFICYQLDRPVDGSRKWVVETVDGVANREAMWNSQPSWQNSNDSIGRAGDPHEVLAVRDGANVIGYAILFPRTNDIAQLAVAPAHRRRGIARSLAAECMRRCAGTPRILNIDAGDEETNAALSRLSSELVRQHEMILAL
jgi:ribosomal protein S18 acetylase RimI-like enzyme